MIKIKRKVLYKNTLRYTVVTYITRIC